MCHLQARLMTELAIDEQRPGRKSVRDRATLVSSLVDGRLDVEASGQWTAECAAHLDTAATQVLNVITPGLRVQVHMDKVTAFDTYGASVLARLARDGRTRGASVEVLQMPDRFVELATNVGTIGIPTAVTAPKAAWTSGLEALGRQMETSATDGLLLLNLLGAVCRALIGVVQRPSSFRLTSTVHQLDRACWQAIPIILLITFLIGGIIAQQGFFHFRKFGAEQYVVDMVGILVTREIGVLLVAIMVAGRSGSSYTAELGSMKMREEIDALQTMGLDPVAVLILPRVLALVVALPALTFLGVIAALYGAGLVAWSYGDMNPNIFIARLHEAISITHFKVGMIKAPFMALVIGIVACSEGLKVRGSAESLGLKTTESVVKSIFLVIVLDGLFAMYFAAIGM
jgi:phospholipid/cholesterol/gamma-HCH transport system permease protein